MGVLFLTGETPPSHLKLLDTPSHVDEGGAPPQSGRWSKGLGQGSSTEDLATSWDAFASGGAKTASWEVSPVEGAIFAEMFMGFDLQVQRNPRVSRALLVSESVVKRNHVKLVNL